MPDGTSDPVFVVLPRVVAGPRLLFLYFGKKTPPARAQGVLCRKDLCWNRICVTFERIDG